MIDLGTHDTILRKPKFVTLAYESLRLMQNSGIDYYAGREHREN